MKKKKEIQELQQVIEQKDFMLGLLMKQAIPKVVAENNYQNSSKAKSIEEREWNLDQMEAKTMMAEQQRMSDELLQNIKEENQMKIYKNKFEKLKKRMHQQENYTRALSQKIGCMEEKIEDECKKRKKLQKEVEKLKTQIRYIEDIYSMFAKGKVIYKKIQNNKKDSKQSIMDKGWCNIIDADYEVL